MSSYSDIPFTPIQVVEVHLDQPITDLISTQPESDVARFLVLVRLHTFPIGIVNITTTERVLHAADLVEKIEHELGDLIAAHLAADGLPQASEPATPTPAGGELPACLVRRRELLENPPFTSVIIATRNRTEQLAIALDSVLAQVYPHFEVIVVDNAPPDSRTYDLLHTVYSGHPHVRYVREDRPGLAMAHNAGIAYASGDILAFTDDDLRADALWLSSLVAAFRHTDHVGCVTGMIMPAELDTPAQVLFEQYSRFNKGFTPQRYDLREYVQPSPLYPYAAGMFGSGASMAFSRECLDAIKGFDTTMGVGTASHGGDDLAAFIDVILAGYCLIYEPAALVWHSHRREYADLRRQVHGYGVGLTAYLTRTMIRYPRHALTMIARVPQAVQHIFGSASPKNSVKPHNYPKELDRLERLGLLLGPAAWLKSWWQAHLWNRQSEA